MPASPLSLPSGVIPLCRVEFLPGKRFATRAGRFSRQLAESETARRDGGESAFFFSLFFLSPTSRLEGRKREKKTKIQNARKLSAEKCRAPITPERNRENPHHTPPTRPGNRVPARPAPPGAALAGLPNPLTRHSDPKTLVPLHSPQDELPAPPAPPRRGPPRVPAVPRRPRRHHQPADPAHDAAAAVLVALGELELLADVPRRGPVVLFAAPAERDAVPQDGTAPREGGQLQAAGR